MRLKSFITAFKNIGRNFFLSTASIISVTATLVILGAILLLIVNINDGSKELKKSIDVGTVVIKQGVSQEGYDELKKSIKGVKNIKSVTLIDKDKALEEYKKNFKDNPDLFSTIGNPLDDMFEIRIIDIEKVKEVEEAVLKLPNVERIYFKTDIIKNVVDMTSLVKNIAVILVVILTFITILIINNTIRVGIASRATEISIMRYVGATRGYIRWPYLIEGIIFGIVGGIISTLILYFGYKEILLFISENTKALSFTKFDNDIPILLNIGFVNLIIGVGVGVLGSVFSLRKYIKV